MDSGPQHHQRKGLCDIVIRPALQSGDDIDLQVIGSQQDHRHPLGRPELPAERKTAPIRQIHVENYQIHLPGKQLSGLCQRIRLQHYIRIRLQGQGDSVVQRAVVFYDQQFHKTSLPVKCIQIAPVQLRRPVSCAVCVTYPAIFRRKLGVKSGFPCMVS